MTFTENQIKALKEYEKHFETAIRSRYARYPGANGVKIIHSIFSEATKSNAKLNPSCSSCIFRLLVDCGTIYFKDKQEMEQMKKADVKPKKTRKKS